MSESSGSVRLDRLVELERGIAGLQAEQLRLLAAFDADPVTVSLPGRGDKSWAVEDVACALRLSPGVARARLAEAVAAARLPGVLASLSTGAITVGHVRVLTEATMPLDDTTAGAVAARVIGRAADQSVGAFRAAVRRAVLAVDVRSVEQRRLANIAERRVCLRRAGEGTSELWALLPDEGAAALMAAVTALAERRNPDDDRSPGTGTGTGTGQGADERSADQRRADALVQLGLDALAGQVSTVLPRRHRLRPAIAVSVALSTLLHLDEQPGELDGVGPIPATLARHLAHDPSGTWRRLVTDPTGQLLDYGRSTYRPPPPLARHVIARDRTCRFPHCTRTATTTELDHTHPWAEGGHTNPANLTALCPRHHHLRHDTRWNYRRTPNDTEWTTPTGRRYNTPAATYPTDTTTAERTADRTADPPPF